MDNYLSQAQWDLMVELTIDELIPKGEKEKWQEFWTACITNSILTGCTFLTNLHDAVVEFYKEWMKFN